MRYCIARRVSGFAERKQRATGTAARNFKPLLFHASDKLGEFLGREVVEGKVAVFKLVFNFLDELLDKFMALIGAHEYIIFFAFGYANMTVLGIETNTQ